MKCNYYFSFCFQYFAYTGIIYRYFLSISYNVISLNFRQNLKYRKLIQDGGHHRFISPGHHGNNMICIKWNFKVQLTFIPNLKSIGLRHNENLGEESNESLPPFFGLYVWLKGLTAWRVKVWWRQIPPPPLPRHEKTWHLSFFFVFFF